MNRKDAIGLSEHGMAMLKVSEARSHIFDSGSKKNLIYVDGKMRFCPPDIQPNPNHDGWEPLKSSLVARRAKHFLASNDGPQTPVHENYGEMKVIDRRPISHTTALGLKCHCDEEFIFIPQAGMNPGENSTITENLVTTAKCPSCGCVWDGHDGPRDGQAYTQPFKFEVAKLKDNKPTGEYITIGIGRDVDIVGFTNRMLFSRDEMIRLAGFKATLITEEEYEQHARAIKADNSLAKLFILGSLLGHK